MEDDETLIACGEVRETLIAGSQHPTMQILFAAPGNLGADGRVARFPATNHDPTCAPAIRYGT
eukprot:15202137-Heterocapsa_arctica.AAC.1